MLALRQPANLLGPLTMNWLARMACVPAVAVLENYWIKR